jgi:ArsR family transcriptional regulator, arsenate/arsenite/antimonite-responsive transcriptional repressor / arsenate reductase (thioredoxin)
MQAERLEVRARVHAALGDPSRLAIVDRLVLSDRAPSELQAELGIDSNLLAHHLRLLERVGLVHRVVSQGDKRRRYVRLAPERLPDLGVGGSLRVGRVVFVCTENIARSQLAAALWNHRAMGVPAASGGTDPKDHVHPGAIRAAASLGLDLRDARPGPIPRARRADLVVTVCDRAHERMVGAGPRSHLHWSIPDPVASRDERAFEVAAATLAARIERLAPALSL